MSKCFCPISLQKIRERYYYYYSLSFLILHSDAFGKSPPGNTCIPPSDVPVFNICILRSTWVIHTVFTVYIAHGSSDMYWEEVPTTSTEAL